MAAVVRSPSQNQQNLAKNLQNPHTSRNSWIPQTPKSPYTTTLIHLVVTSEKSTRNIPNQDTIDYSNRFLACRYQGANQKQLNNQHQKQYMASYHAQTSKFQVSTTINPLNHDTNRHKIQQKTTNLYDEPCIQDKTGSSRTLFQENQANAANNNSNMGSSKSRTPPNHTDTMMTKSTNNKKQHGDESTENSKSRVATDNEEQRRSNSYHKLNLWFGFHMMEQLTKDAGQ